MRKFDLQEAKDGKCVITKEGRAVRIVDFNMRISPDEIGFLAIIDAGDGHDVSKCYHNDGIPVYIGPDIFMKEEEHIVYAPVRGDGSIVYGLMNEDINHVSSMAESLCPTCRIREIKLFY